MMTRPFLRRQLALTTANLLLCMASTLPAFANTASEAQTRFRQDMAACNSGQSNQDLATCRLEARNALADAKRGSLNDVPGKYTNNALQRCNALEGNNRSDCESRMRGEGRIEGSVDSGGIIRETVTVVPAR